MIKQIYFKQFSISHLFKLNLNVRVIAMKEYSAFPKDPALLEPHYQIV